MPMQHMKASESAQCYASTLCENFQTIARCHANATWKIPNQLGAMPAQHMKVPKWARCHTSATHEGSQMSSVPCQRNTWRLPKQARCHVSAIHEGSRTSSETQKLLVQAIDETVWNVKFFLKANSVIEEQKSTVRFAGTCSWSDCISSPNISSFVGHGLMNGAVAPCSAFTSRVKVRMYMSLCLHVIAGFTHTPLSHTPSFTHNFVTHTPSFFVTQTFICNFVIHNLHHLLCFSFHTRPCYHISCWLLEEVDLWGYPVL